MIADLAGARSGCDLTCFRMANFALFYSTKAQTSAEDALAKMGRYFFHLHECGTLISDEEGMDFTDLDGARENAIAAARDVMSAEVKAGKLCLGCRIEVKDQSGAILLILPFREALMLRGL